MANMSSEIVGARDTVLTLIKIHRRTIASIEQGERLHKGRADVTRTVLEASVKELRQCESVLDALNHMDAGSIQRASELLSQIKEYLPHDN
jgi:hypothetical protein